MVGNDKDVRSMHEVLMIEIVQLSAGFNDDNDDDDSAK